MTKYIIAVALIMMSFLDLRAQANPDVILNDSYNTVLGKIKNEITYDFYNITKTKDKIAVSVKPGSGLHEKTIVEYYFKNNILIRIIMIQDVPNPDAMMSYIYQSHSADKGAPKILNKNGHKTYLWKIDGVNHYFYKAWSDWFGKVCFFLQKEI